MTSACKRRPLSAAAGPDDVVLRQEVADRHRAGLHPEHLERDVLGVPAGRVGVAHRDSVHGRAVPAQHRHRVRPRLLRQVAREHGVRVRLRVAGHQAPAARPLHACHGVLLPRRALPPHDRRRGPHVAGPEAGGGKVHHGFQRRGARLPLAPGRGRLAVVQRLRHLRRLHGVRVHREAAEDLGDLLGGERDGLGIASREELGAGHRGVGELDGRLLTGLQVLLSEEERHAGVVVQLRLRCGVLVLERADGDVDGLLARVHVDANPALANAHRGATRLAVPGIDADADATFANANGCTGAAGFGRVNVNAHSPFPNSHRGAAGLLAAAASTDAALAYEHAGN
jgi:hypothetical protein|uniref:Uncharacterized protein n=1 Tax=Zea mays TaxID=4577 RepID=C0HDW7_MAIZE|nr:unknown [Zea mays]ACR35471.1 unknown [Zea mays]ACR35919.1 unknown [Zea mays]